MFGLTYPPIFHETRYKIVNLVQRHAKQTSDFPELISQRQEMSLLLHSILQKQRIPICFLHIITNLYGSVFTVRSFSPLTGVLTCLSWTTPTPLIENSTSRWLSYSASIAAVYLSTVGILN
jgi:hypothetical protein